MTTSLSEAQKASTVQQYRLVVHTMGPVVPGAQLSQNHWSVFLITSWGSVRLHMLVRSSTSADNTGQLNVTAQSYQHSQSAIKEWDIEAALPATVENVLSLLYGNRRDQYLMTENGTGCRYWAWVAMQDMVQAGYAQRLTHTQEDVTDIIQFNYSFAMQPVYLEIQAGTFV
ncbi:MAG: hypothetical protein M1832_005130 [Thelocarpon impressellum]|nr:MAG: hypothetical protein M1832_005130 [Thelocarpon impressellum]